MEAKKTTKRREKRNESTNGQLVLTLENEAFGLTPAGLAATGPTAAPTAAAAEEPIEAVLDEAENVAATTTTAPSRSEVPACRRGVRRALESNHSDHRDLDHRLHCCCRGSEMDCERNTVP